MIIGYKSLKENLRSKKKFFEFSDSHFELYDEGTLQEKIRRVQFLISSIMNEKNYIFSKSYLNNIQELTNLVYKVDFNGANQDDLESFFNYLLTNAGENNYRNVEKNEILFLSFAKLILSFASQDEPTIYLFFKCGFMNYVKFLLGASFPTRIDNNAYEALAKIATKSRRLQNDILNTIKIQMFQYLIKNNDQIGDEKRLDYIFKFLASLTKDISEDEFISIIKMYIDALENQIEQVYPAIGIGLYEKIRSINSYHNYKNYKTYILKIYPLLVKRMDNDPTLCEYTFYITTALLKSKVNIKVNYAIFQNYLKIDNPQIQIASIFFFSSIATEPQILIEQKLDVVQFIWELHLIYQDSSYVIKEYLDEAIFFYLILDIYDKNQLFTILEKGFTDTLIQIIQTKRNDLVAILRFLLCIFEQSIKMQCEAQFAAQFLELGGFNVLHEYLNNYEFVSAEKNLDTVNVIQHIVQNYEPNVT